MIWLVLAMASDLVIAAVVTAYVAFPRRGVDLPVVPALGHALERGVENLPTLDLDRTGR
jgi:enoyl-CoA hydratase/carnithine racemase